jgi:hypothetical protein
MPGPLPKPATQRRRPNAGKGSTNLRATDAPTVPKLPFTVCEATQTWWTDIWTSQMAGEWLPSDRHGLVLLARLVEDYWTAEDAGLRAKLAVEIRLQRQCYGLAPLDRRRLQWNVVETPKTAPVKAPARRQSKPDPRLKVI